MKGSPAARTNVQIRLQDLFGFAFTAERFHVNGNAIFGLWNDGFVNLLVTRSPCLAEHVLEGLNKISFDFPISNVVFNDACCFKFLGVTSIIHTSF